MLFCFYWSCVTFAALPGIDVMVAGGLSGNREWRKAIRASAVYIVEVIGIL